MSYSESSRGVLITEQRARLEIERHGLSCEAD